MSFGQGALFVAFAAAIIAAFLSAWRSSHGIRFAKWAVLIHSGAVTAGSVYLVNALLSHDFRYRYVYSHTDRALAWPYRFSAFWAGPQGSLLFWVLGGALALVTVMYLQRNRPHPLVGAVLALSQACLLWLVLLDSPFQRMLTLPVDGRGINALLLNPWMTVHPPIILLGYAFLAVPLAYSVAALITRDYDGGLFSVLPWTVLSWLLLGGGIVIGGVWAYQVLGWGGFWGWDPVENSSLVPWLTASALVHGLLVQRKRGNMLRSNHFLAITTYLLVLLATFITRSGLMADEQSSRD